MYIFLYLGFNLLNISKSAAPDFFVCRSSFVLLTANPTDIFYIFATRHTPIEKKFKSEKPLNA